MLTSILAVTGAACLAYAMVPLSMLLSAEHSPARTFRLRRSVLVSVLVGLAAAWLVGIAGILDLLAS